MTRKHRTGRELSDHLLDVAEEVATGAEMIAPGEGRVRLLEIGYALVDAHEEIERLRAAAGFRVGVA